MSTPQQIHMRDSRPLSVILFEPWGLGDAIIAGAVGVHIPGGCKLACNSKWHELLKAVFCEESISFVPMDLSYTSRGGTGFKLPPAASPDRSESKPVTRNLVLSARGDPRDFLIARTTYPGSIFKVKGFAGFLARQLKPMDFLFSAGILPVTNRYRVWAQIAGVDFSLLEQRFSRLKSQLRPSRSVAIHIGAQWKARQYPYVKDLRDRLEIMGLKVVIVAGPGDPLPAGIERSQVTTAINADLIAIFKQSAFVVVNDSAPMHLASALGVPSICAARLSNIAEWLPVGSTPVCSEMMPRGHWIDKSVYLKDDIVSGWPDPNSMIDEAKLLTPDPALA